MDLPDQQVMSPTDASAKVVVDAGIEKEEIEEGAASKRKSRSTARKSIAAGGKLAAAAAEVGGSMASSSGLASGGGVPGDLQAVIEQMVMQQTQDLRREIGSLKSRNEMLTKRLQHKEKQTSEFGTKETKGGLAFTVDVGAKGMKTSEAGGKAEKVEGVLSSQDEDEDEFRTSEAGGEAENSKEVKAERFLMTPEKGSQRRHHGLFSLQKQR